MKELIREYNHIRQGSFPNVFKLEEEERAVNLKEIKANLNAQKQRLLGVQRTLEPCEGRMLTCLPQMKMFPETGELQPIWLVSEDEECTVTHGGETCNIQINESKRQTSNPFAYFYTVRDYLDSIVPPAGLVLFLALKTKNKELKCWFKL